MRKFLLVIACMTVSASCRGSNLPSDVEAVTRTIKIRVKGGDTWLKKTTAQSTTLKLASEKCSLYANQTYEIQEAPKTNGSHLLVNLRKMIPGCGFSRGYLFAAHVTVDSGSSAGSSASAVGSGGGGGGPITGREVRCTSYSTGYYPHNSLMEGGYFDRFGGTLKTLQDYLDGKAPYVTIAMDIPFSAGTASAGGRRVRIPELEKAYNNGKFIDFRVLDTGGAFIGKGAKKVDICMKNWLSTLDLRINRNVTVVFVDGGVSCQP